MLFLRTNEKDLNAYITGKGGGGVSREQKSSGNLNMLTGFRRLDLFSPKPLGQISLVKRC